MKAKAYDLILAKISKRFVQDPVLIESCKQLFRMANNYGLEGIKLTDLKFIFPDEGGAQIKCLRHLSEEEWKQYQEQDI